MNNTIKSEIYKKSIILRALENDELRANFIIPS